MLIRSDDDRVLLCQLTYKRDYDLPGGVVEVTESPQLAVAREVKEELQLDVPAGRLLLTDWLPPWGGWDDAICLVFDGGTHDPAVVEGIVRQEREIRSAGFYTLAEVRELCADFTARRIESALRNLSAIPRAVVHRERARARPRSGSSSSSVARGPMLSAAQPRRTIFSAMWALVQAVIVHTATQTRATAQEKCAGSWPRANPAARPA